MTPEDFRAQLQQEVDWRSNEITLLKNVISSEADELKKEVLRRSLVLVLYAHFEGFCVFALRHYQNAINSAAPPCREVTAAILAGAWEPTFNAMQSGDEKCKEFKTPLPNDEGLHRHWRRRHFIDQIDNFLTRPVTIPDDVINAESNLKPVVLRRNLFVLGLDHHFITPHEATIKRLLDRRNRIAHGQERRGVSQSDYAGFEAAVFEIRDRLFDFLHEAHRNLAFLKPFPDIAI